jgi:hypothetical protein
MSDRVKPCPRNLYSYTPIEELDKEIHVGLGFSYAFYSSSSHIRSSSNGTTIKDACLLLLHNQIHKTLLTANLNKRLEHILKCNQFHERPSVCTVLNFNWLQQEELSSSPLSKHDLETLK